MGGGRRKIVWCVLYIPRAEERRLALSLHHYYQRVNSALNVYEQSSHRKTKANEQEIKMKILCWKAPK